MAVAAELPGDPGFQTTVTAPAPAAAAPREDRSAAASVVLPSDSPRAYDDLGSLLLQVPGVTVTRTGSSQSFSSVTLRGGNPDQVLIYVDGVPLNIAEGGGVDVSTLPLGDVERVEVYRGTSPLAFGESALGGIISITTRTPGLARATARAGVGSFQTAFGDASASGRAGRLRLYLGGHVFSSKGDYPLRYNLTPTNPTTEVDTVRQNNDTLEGNGVFRAMVSLAGRRALTLDLIGFGRAQGLPGPDTFPAMHARFHTARGLGTLRYESRDDLGPGGRVEAEAFVSLQRDRLLDPDGEAQSRGPMFAHQTTLSIGSRVHGTRPLGEWGRAAVVLEGRRETFTPVDELDPPSSGVAARRLTGVAGAELALFWHRLDLEIIPSVRVEALDDQAASTSTRALPTYRLGLVRPLSAVATVKANLGEYHRAPSFLELYGDGTPRLLGNAGLVPESGTNADVGLWIDRPVGRVAVVSRTTLFGALAGNLIYWLPTAGGPSRAQNLNRARIYGVEQELQLTLGRHARVVAQATYLVANDESDNPTTRGKAIPHHPRLSTYARPELVRVGVPYDMELGFYADASVLNDTYEDPANVFRIATQALVGVGASLARPRSCLRFTLSALNLMDLPTFNATDWLLPGRTVFLSLAYDSSPTFAEQQP